MYMALHEVCENFYKEPLCPGSILCIVTRFTIESFSIGKSFGNGLETVKNPVLRCSVFPTRALVPGGV